MKDGFKYVNQLNSNMIIVEGQSSYEENDGKLYIVYLTPNNNKRWKLK